MEVMIVFTKREKKKDLKKLEKEITKKIQEYNTEPLSEITTEMSFIIDIDEKNLEKLSKTLEKTAESNGFELEIIKK